MIKIEQSVVYPDVWYLRLNGSTHQLTEGDIKELIAEARRVYKTWEN